MKNISAQLCMFVMIKPLGVMGRQQRSLNMAG